MDVIEKEKIFNNIYSKKIEQVQWYCRRYVREAEAIELAHDVFLNFYQNLDKFRGDSKYETWLFQITKNACNNHYRYTKATKRSGHVFSLDAEKRPNAEYSPVKSAWLEDKKPSIARIVESKDILDLVMFEINRMNEKHRKTFMHFIESDGFKSQEEVCSILGIKANKLKSRLVRARKFLISRTKIKRLLAHGSIV